MRTQILLGIIRYVEFLSEQFDPRYYFIVLMAIVIAVISAKLAFYTPIQNNTRRKIVKFIAFAALIPTTLFVQICFLLFWIGYFLIESWFQTFMNDKSFYVP